jgi:hypothetical protein
MILETPELVKDTQLLYINVLKWLVSLALVVGMVLFYMFKKDTLVNMLHLLLIRNSFVMMDFEQRRIRYDPIKLQAFVSLQSNACWVLLMMLALHQKRGKFKFVSIIVYISIVVLGSNIMIS